MSRYHNSCKVKQILHSKGSTTHDTDAMLLLSLGPKVSELDMDQQQCCCCKNDSQQIYSRGKMTTTQETLLAADSDQSGWKVRKCIFVLTALQNTGSSILVKGILAA